jgi:hypothetical protein
MMLDMLFDCCFSGGGGERSSPSLKQQRQGFDDAPDGGRISADECVAGRGARNGVGAAAAADRVVRARASSCEFTTEGAVVVLLLLM